MMRRSPYKLTNLPKDYISSIKFHETFEELLMVSSWDSAVRVYDTDRKSLVREWDTEDPCLDCMFSGISQVLYGGTSGKLKMRDVNSTYDELIGTHDDTIENIEFSKRRNLVITGSWDKTIKLWDLRVKGCISTHGQADGAVYSVNVVGSKIAVGTDYCRALIWDLRQMKSHLILHRLNYTVNCIAISPNKEYYVIGHNRGRVSVAYFKKDPEIRSRKLSFKCHRMRAGEIENIYGVFALQFYNANGIFATGGGNGFVNVWDAINKRQVHHYPRHQYAVSSMAFSADKNKLAVACSEHNHEATLEQPINSTIKIWYVDKQKYEQPIKN